MVRSDGVIWSGGSGGEGRGVKAGGQAVTEHDDPLNT